MDRRSFLIGAALAPAAAAALPHHAPAAELPLPTVEVPATPPPNPWAWYGTNDGERYARLDASTLEEAIAEAMDSEYETVAEARLPKSIHWHFIDLHHNLYALDDINYAVVDGDDDCPSTILTRDHPEDVNDLQARINAVIDAWVIERNMNDKIRPWAFIGVRNETPVPTMEEEE